ncbi:MAG: Sec-independent protein translocase protein TatB [Desulfobulbaceae bacterium]|nr:Sec-independent protein translocase protein TatB [Desulfobulbaceae bacterium]
MFGIGLPEMIVILAVALIVVGPDKLPDMARSVAKWVFELKKTVNQVKESLEDEEGLIGSVHSDLRKTGEDLKGRLLESDHLPPHKPGGTKNGDNGEHGEVIDVDADHPGQEDALSRDKEAAPEAWSRERKDAVPDGDSEDEERPPEPAS